jgi:O-antigen/teichoic acid export membrane protein
VAAGSLFFSVFEAFGWFAGRNVFTNFLRETGLRLYQLGCLVLFVTGVVHFDLFITIYSCTFLVIALVLLAVLLRSRQVYFYAGISAVTRKYAGKAANYSVFIYITGIVSQLTLYVDGVFIGSLSKEGLTDVAVYSIAGFIANTIMVPQRSIVAATLPILSKAWKDKNYTEIRRLYYRSSLNLLIIGLVIFFTIWLSLSDMMHAFNFNKSYLAAMPAVFLLGLARIIECGTGINGQIIATSRHWKYEVVAGMILLAVMMPLDYLLIRKYNFIGAAYANLISLLVYNIFRTIVMKVKFNMLPFSRKTLYAVLYLTVLYGVCYLAFRHLYGWAGLIVRSTVFLSAAAAGILLFNLSPDVTAVCKNLLARVSGKY